MEEFYTAYPLINMLYGVDIDKDTFEDIGLIAWRKIGNKQYRMYNYSSDLEEDSYGKFYIDLPCNCDEIEAVTYG